MYDDSVRTNKAWEETPLNWNCPTCKRHKQMLVRRDRSNGTFASLEDHHDHIHRYVFDRAAELQCQLRLNTVLDEDENRFLTRWLVPFFERFRRTLICGDCNAADAAAKAKIPEVCRYFSFSPREIGRFIDAQPGKPHSIDPSIAGEIYQESLETHNYRKLLADTLIARMLNQNRLWGEALSGPSRAHYRSVSQAASSEISGWAMDWDTPFKGKDNNIGGPRWHLFAPEKKTQRSSRKRRRSSLDEVESKHRVPKRTLSPIRSTPSNRDDLEWTEAEDARLLSLATKGEAVSDLAMDFGKSELEVTRRLEVLLGKR
ncbi:MAG: hypothetical protein EP335_06840 [Alphaproteobacteria bacterium]|nr:MAG: hypothetical protein EP335_06840 [Alphaproteobacteria bacterium]